MQKPLIAGIGELLWDIFPEGKKPGGAPTNFAFHANQAGSEGILISAVGNDPLGEELLLTLNELKLNTNYVQKNGFSTGTVTVQRDQNGQPRYTIHENTAWDNIELIADIKGIAGKLDAVCFGTLGQRSPASAKTISEVLNSLKPDCLKIFDVNLRQHFFSEEVIEASLQKADIFKLNDEELVVIAEMFEISVNEEEQLEQLVSLFNLKYLVYTLGAKGSFVLSPDKKSFLNAPEVKVADTVGAGDSFIAVFTSCILKGESLKTAHEKANKAAAYVCTQKGACPVFPDGIV